MSGDQPMRRALDFLDWVGDQSPLPEWRWIDVVLNWLQWTAIWRVQAVFDRVRRMVAS